MREVIDFNKNFLTGEVTEVKKYKEDTMYRGTATIQVFDKEGKVIQEAKSTNFIHPGLSSYLYTLYFKNMLLYQGSRYQSINNLIPASHIMLTNNTKAENPNNYIIEGDIIGYASGWGTYSGSDNLLGTLNTAETSISDWSRHIVIDFPTHASNGTFQSIYWTNGRANTSGVCMNSLVSGKINSTSGYGTMTVFKNKVYMIKSNKDARIIMIIDKISGEIIEEKVLNFLSVDITSSDTHLYIIENNGKNIYKMDENLNIVQTLSFSKTMYNPSSYAYARLIYSDEGLVVLYISNQNNFLVAVLDENTGAIKKELDFGNILRNYYMHTLLYDNYILMTKSIDSTNEQKRVYYYDIKNNKLIDNGVGDNFKFIPHERWNGSEPCFITSTVDRATKEVYTVTSAQYALVKGTFMPYFSHTLLPAPITKTSANTMKIQYDFVVEPRGAFQI